MSHRVHPKGFRLKKMKDWNSRGFYEKKASRYLEEDFKIRKFLKDRLKTANVLDIEIERFPAKIQIIISSSRPGLIIGRGGKGVEELSKEIEKLLFVLNSIPTTGKQQRNSRQIEKKAIKIEIQGIRNPWASAKLTAQWIAQRIEKRIPFRRVLKQALSKIMSNREIEGAKVQVSGRLNGVEMARTEWLREGKLPRQTLRSNIDYGKTEAHCTYGVIGVKVWIYKGERT
jgi:small subunit ribosomal protein S3